MRRGKKKTNEYRMLRVARDLTPEKQIELLKLVRRAYTEEKSSGDITADGGVSVLNQLEFSSGNIFSKKRSNE